MNAQLDRYHAADDLLLNRAGDGRTLAQRLSKRYAARITGAFVVPGREGSYAPLPDDLPPALARALRARGIDHLYSHQAQAWATSEVGPVPVAVNVSGRNLVSCGLVERVPDRVGRGERQHHARRD